MSTKQKRTSGIWVFVLGFPIFVIVGAVLALRGVLRFVRGIRAVRLGLARELRCPHGHTNAVNGRWECASCKALYIGWVGKCSCCGAGASWFPCERCGVSIPVPWERR